jgi:hypothetical protein
MTAAVHRIDQIRLTRSTTFKKLIVKFRIENFYRQKRRNKLPVGDIERKLNSVAPVAGDGAPPPV